MSTEVDVTFIQEAKNGETITLKAQLGEFLNQVAYRAGVVIQQTCGGVPSCTDCKVVVKEGVEGGFEPSLGPELRLMGNIYFITHERLSCQAKVAGPSQVFVPTPRRPVQKDNARMALINRQRREREEDALRSTGEKSHGQKENQEKSSRQEARQESGQKSREESREENGKEKAGSKKGSR